MSIKVSLAVLFNALWNCGAGAQLCDQLNTFTLEYRLLSKKQKLPDSKIKFQNSE
jgi:hypothetical protein